MSCKYEKYDCSETLWIYAFLLPLGTSNSIYDKCFVFSAIQDLFWSEILGRFKRLRHLANEPSTTCGLCRRIH